MWVIVLIVVLPVMLALVAAYIFVSVSLAVLQLMFFVTLGVLRVRTPRIIVKR